MTVRQLFVGSDGRLRAVWRVVAFLAFTFAAINLVAVFVGPIVNEFFSLVGVRGLSNDTWVEALGALLGPGYFEATRRTGTAHREFSPSPSRFFV